MAGVWFGLGARTQIGNRFGGDKVSCPECGKDMEGVEDHDEIWRCEECGDEYGLDDDWHLTPIPMEPDADHYVKSQKEMRAERDLEEDV